MKPELKMRKVGEVKVVACCYLQSTELEGSLVVEHLPSTWEILNLQDHKIKHKHGRRWKVCLDEKWSFLHDFLAGSWGMGTDRANLKVYVIAEYEWSPMTVSGKPSLNLNAKGWSEKKTQKGKEQKHVLFEQLFGLFCPTTWKEISHATGPLIKESVLLGEEHFQPKWHNFK